MGLAIARDCIAVLGRCSNSFYIPCDICYCSVVGSGMKNASVGIGHNDMSSILLVNVLYAAGRFVVSL